jgi:hypothetical protein
MLTRDSIGPGQVLVEVGTIRHGDVDSIGSWIDGGASSPVSPTSVARGVLEL